MKCILILTTLLFFSCKNIVSGNSSSDIPIDYHPGMSQEEISLPASFSSTLVGVNSGEVTISWASSNLASNYKIVYGTSIGSYTTVYSTNASSPVTITGLTNGTNYYFRVVAENVNGTKNSTNEIIAMPMLPPSDPTTLTLDSVTSHIANISWSSSTGNGSITYKVYRSLTTGGGFALIASGITGNTYSDTGLTTGQTYYYVITATNEGGSSQYSNEISALIP